MVFRKRILLSAILMGIVVGFLAFQIRPLFAYKEIASNFAVLKEKTNVRTLVAKPLTLHGAWEVAQDFALVWCYDARLISLVSTDVDDPDAMVTSEYKVPGTEGKRRSWQAVFTSPSRNKQLFVQVTDGKVVEAIEDGIHDPGLATVAEQPILDSPELVELATSNYPDMRAEIGVTAVGFHFMFEATGIETGESTLKIRGSRKVRGQSHPLLVIFSQVTGRQIRAQQYEQQQGGAKWTTDF